MRIEGSALSKSIVFSAHAEQVIIERALERAWIEEAVTTADWTVPDPSDPTLERRFRTVPERDGRTLRVVCRENDDTIEIVTAFLDRRARRPT